MLSYRAILRQAWKISWKYKFLWFFGFFASLISFTAEFKIISRSLNQNLGLKSLGEIKMFLDTGIFSQDALSNIKELFKTETQTMMILLLVLLLILGIMVFFAWLSTVSQVAIIDSVNKVMKGRPGVLSIKRGLKMGNKKFWPVFFMNIIISCIINIIFLLIGLMLLLVLMNNNIGTTLLYGLIFILFVPISLFLSFIFKYAIAYIVLENKKFFNAIKQGWRLFFNNWIISVEMSIVLFFINIVTIILISIISMAGLLLFAGLAFSSALFLSSGILFWTSLIIGGLFLLLVTILGGSILNVFQISSWTDLFVQLRDNKASSKLERMFRAKK